MHPSQSDRRIDTTSGLTAIRRFRGPVADEVFLLCRPADATADAGRQAETAYEALGRALDAEGIAGQTIVTETVFFRDVARDFDAVRAARSRVLGRSGQALPASTCIGQPPLDDDGALALSAVAVCPHAGGEGSAPEVRVLPACRCPACAGGARARVVRLGDEMHLYAGNVYGSGRDACGEAIDMFRVAERLLAEAGMGFGDVMRTWIHLRDIDRDYDALNHARREFFRGRGIERRPASTGVQGIPHPAAHAFSLSLHAVTSSRPLDVALMCTPSLNEAWSYGSDFSRGLRLTDANKTTLYVSGTASIDEAGRTAHAGDLDAQARRMLHNMTSLLEGQGAGFEDVVSAVVYVKRPEDAPALRAMLRERGIAGFPCVVVEAPLCRPELLCEAEAVALLSLAAPGA